jgi:hypothetical protein
MNIDKFKKMLLPYSGSIKIKFLRDLKSYVYVYCEIDEENRRLPIYVGRGKGERLLAHLKNINDPLTDKSKKISNLLKENRLGIDILAYNLTEKGSADIESACIDLMGVENIENLVRGKGDNVKRIPLNELAHKLVNKKIKVKSEHRGIAILLKHYKPHFGYKELFEITRGIWNKKMKTASENCEAKLAYATFNGIVKDVYTIHSWVPAGTQAYFTRPDIKSSERIQKFRWEFVGTRAPEEIREQYVGKIIERERSFGDPYVFVGY